MIPDLRHEFEHENLQISRPRSQDGKPKEFQVSRPHCIDTAQSPLEKLLAAQGNRDPQFGLASVDLVPPYLE